MTLADRIAHFLASSPGSTVPEIARAVRRRDDDVRTALTSDPRFLIVPAPERSPKARCWSVGYEHAGRVGTSAEGHS
jgi:hypothetical protein